MTRRITGKKRRNEGGGFICNMIVQSVIAQIPRHLAFISQCVIDEEL
jgi:hypothetical protein